MVHSTPSRQKARELRKKADAIAKEAKALEDIIGPDNLCGTLWVQSSDLHAEAKALADAARLEDLSVRQESLTKPTKKGDRTYYRWVASWREGSKTKKVYVGGVKKLSQTAALQKARRLKAEALGLVVPH